MRRDRELIRRLYVEDNLSTVQVGSLVGLSPGAVGSVLRHLGIKLRNAKEGWQTRFPNGRFGDISGHWKGGKRHYSKGYIGIYSPSHPHATKDGYVMEHRLVMEKQLGRYLLLTEMVHHKNRNKSDNRPENLQLVADHKEHSHVYFENAVENDRLKRILNEHNIPF